MQFKLVGQMGHIRVPLNSGSKIVLTLLSLYFAFTPAARLLKQAALTNLSYEAPRHNQERWPREN